MLDLDIYFVAMLMFYFVGRLGAAAWQSEDSKKIRGAWTLMCAAGVLVSFGLYVYERQVVRQWLSGPPRSTAPPVVEQ